MRFEYSAALHFSFKSTIAQKSSASCHEQKLWRHTPLDLLPSTSSTLQRNEGPPTRRAPRHSLGRTAALLQLRYVSSGQIISCTDLPAACTSWILLQTVLLESRQCDLFYVRTRSGWMGRRRRSDCRASQAFPRLRMGNHCQYRSWRP